MTMIVESGDRAAITNTFCQSEAAMTKTHPIDICAEDVMQRQLITIRANEPLAAVEQQLSEAGVSGAPVMDEAGKLLGVISMRDLMRHHTEDRELPSDADVTVFDGDIQETEQVAFSRPDSGACAADVMTQDIVSVPPSMPLPLIAQRMLEHRVHRVMVMDRGRFVGLVSATELLGALAGMA